MELDYSWHLAWLFKSWNSAQLLRLFNAHDVFSDSPFGSSFSNLYSFDFNKKLSTLLLLIIKHPAFKNADWN